MKCTKCNGKGYIVDRMLLSASEKQVIKQCCDITAYSQAIQELIRTRATIDRTDEAVAREQLGEATQPNNVIPFRRKI